MKIFQKEKGTLEGIRMDNEKTARKNLLRKSEEIKGVKIEGYDFDKGVDYSKIVESFYSTGFQATQLAKAIEITNEMIAEKAFIFLGYTSNMVSSGLRDIFRWLVKEKKVNAVVSVPLFLQSIKEKIEFKAKEKGKLE